MSNNQWSCNGESCDLKKYSTSKETDESGKSKSGKNEASESHEAPKNEENSKRQEIEKKLASILSWHENNQQNESRRNDRPSHVSLCDDDLTQNSIRWTQEYGSEVDRKDEVGSQATLQDKTRCSSLSEFELNEYTLADLRKFHERLVKHQANSSKAPKEKFFKNFSKKQSMVLACLCLAEFSSFCSMSIMAPFFPKEALDKGMSETTAGFVFSFYALVIFLSSPFLGKVLPHVGAKFLFLSGLFLTSSCNFLFGLLGFIKQEWVFTVYCFIVQGMKALGASAYSTATYVFVAEIFPSNISSVLGVMETFVGLGMSVGPAIGGFFYQIGGFGLPFYILGSILLLTVPVAYFVLPLKHGNSVKKKAGSFLTIFKEPSVAIIGLVVVANSNVWAFLDPTLEPHLREFDLTPEMVGVIFLLFSALYGISSPLWGIVSNKTNNHWFMMTSGLLLATVGLLLLGPAPFLPFLTSELWLDLVALSILGVSVSLSLLPTFQGLITSITDSGLGRNDITTYSIVSGVWSSFYALGEVIGPLAGSYMAEHYGFSICCTVMAVFTFTLAVESFLFFTVRNCLKRRNRNNRYNFEVTDEQDSESSIYSDELLNRPLLKPGYRSQLYTVDKSGNEIIARTNNL